MMEFKEHKLEYLHQKYNLGELVGKLSKCPVSVGISRKGDDIYYILEKDSD